MLPKPNHRNPRIDTNISHIPNLPSGCAPMLFVMSKKWPQVAAEKWDYKDFFHVHLLSKQLNDTTKNEHGSVWSPQRQIACDSFLFLWLLLLNRLKLLTFSHARKWQTYTYKCISNGTQCNVELPKSWTYQLTDS